MIRLRTNPVARRGLRALLSTSLNFPAVIMAAGLFAGDGQAQEYGVPPAQLCTYERATGPDWANFSGSLVRLEPTDAPGAVAQIVIDNRPCNGPADNVTHPLTLGSVDVSVTFTWDAVGASDAVSVEAGPGLIAVPIELAVPEHEQGTILIYPLQGEGM